MLVEATDHIGCELKEGDGVGAVGADAVFGVGQWKAAEFLEQKTLQHFDYGGEEGDGAIAGAIVCGFSGFKEDDEGRNVFVSVGEN